MKKQGRPTLSFGGNIGKNVNTYQDKSSTKEFSKNAVFSMPLGENSIVGASCFFSHSRSASQSLTKTQAHMFAPFYAYIFSPEWVAALFAGIGKVDLKYFDRTYEPNGKTKNMVYLAGGTLTYIFNVSDKIFPSLRGGLTWTDSHKGSYVNRAGTLLSSKTSSLVAPISFKISYSLTANIKPYLILEVSTLLHKLNKTIKRRYSYDITPGFSIKNKKGLTFRLYGGYDRNYRGAREYLGAFELRFPL